MADPQDTHTRETEAGDAIWQVPAFMPAIGDSWMGDLHINTLKFNQAYVINSVANEMGQAVAIEGMEEVFSGGPQDITDYYVEIALNKETLYVESAVFKGIRTKDASELGQLPEGEMPVGEFPEIIFADDTGDMGTGFLGGEVYSGFYPVCTVEGNGFPTFIRRDNIELSDRQFKQMGNFISGCPRSEEEVELGNSGSGWGGSGEAHILIKEGKSAPPVRVRSIGAGEGICVTQEENTIVIESLSELTGQWSGINTDRNWFEVYGEAPQFTHPDGTASVPAKFRTLEEGSGIKMSYQGQDGDGNWRRIKFDLDKNDMTGFWSGECCGDNELDTFCVYQEADATKNKGDRSMGTPDDPAIFRRLSGVGNIDIWYGDENGDPVSEGCLIVISGASGCLSGVTNCEDVFSLKGAGVYRSGNCPSVLRRLKGKGLLMNDMGQSTVKISSLDNDIIEFDAIWSGQNTECTNGVSVYKQPDTSPYDGEMQNPAVFKQLVGAATTPHPVSATAGYPQINVMEEGADCVRVRGNGIDGSLTIASGIWVDMYDPAGHPVLGTTNTITLTWRDGLITTEGDFTQVYTQPPE